MKFFAPATKLHVLRDVKFVAIPIFAVVQVFCNAFSDCLAAPQMKQIAK